ncbi:MAG: metabolite traffic protein EboE [Marinobacterium sp.]|nr:metabolite traffic protein EboE [Marinobacterium sp.]
MLNVTSARRGWCSSELAYCSNLHPGETLQEVLDNLRRYLAPVRQQRGLTWMDAGLWLSANVAVELQHPASLSVFRQTLQSTGVRLTSLNGFPAGMFHQHGLKAGVYQPDWSVLQRLEYSMALARILAACLPDDVTTGVISTVPLGYRVGWTEQKHQAAQWQLMELCHFLADLRQQTGKHIIFALEMEPDCVLERSDELVEFLQTLSLQDSGSQSDSGDKVSVLEYLGCCFDVCHQAVVHEDICQALVAIRSAGINIAKIQLSSALEVDLNKPGVAKALVEFCEPRYLHQVKAINSAGDIAAFEDLPCFLDTLQQDTALWRSARVHFHVPLYQQKLADLSISTTSAQLLQLFDYLVEQPHFQPVLEVETYSWQVMPEADRPLDDCALIQGVCDELGWVEAMLAQRGCLACDGLLEGAAVMDGNAADKQTGNVVQ